MHISIMHLIHHYGYAGLFVILMAEAIGIPFPAETVLTVAGIGWIKGSLSLLPLLLAATAGNMVGAAAAYAIGRYVGRHVIIRYGKYVGITHERLDKAERTFLKYETTVVFTSKFIAGIRVLVPYLAGMNKVPFVKFELLNGISAFAWATVFVLLGRYVNLAWSRYHSVMHKYMLPAAIVLLIAAGIAIAWKKRRSKATAE